MKWIDVQQSAVTLSVAERQANTITITDTVALGGLSTPDNFTTFRWFPIPGGMRHVHSLESTGSHLDTCNENRCHSTKEINWKRIFFQHIHLVSWELKNVIYNRWRVMIHAPLCHYFAKQYGNQLNFLWLKQSDRFISTQLLHYFYITTLSQHIISSQAVHCKFHNRDNSSLPALTKVQSSTKW